MARQDTQIRYLKKELFSLIKRKFRTAYGSIQRKIRKIRCARFLFARLRFMYVLDRGWFGSSEGVGGKHVWLQNQFSRKW
jgi:hypothetical protein